MWDYFSIANEINKTMENTKSICSHIKNEDKNKKNLLQGNPNSFVFPLFTWFKCPTIVLMSNVSEGITNFWNGLEGYQLCRHIEVCPKIKKKKYTLN